MALGGLIALVLGRQTGRAARRDTAAGVAAQAGLRRRAVAREASCRGTDGVAGIEITGLQFSFGGPPVLRGVDLRVEQGSVLTVFGPNGAGKTTLLKILAGLLRPSRGSVVIDGRRRHRAPNSLRRLIGMISHQPYLYPQLTGRENLEFYARLYGLDDPRGRARRMLEEMGLSAGRRVRGRDLLARHAAATWPWPVPSCTTPGCSCSTSRSPGLTSRVGSNSPLLLRGLRDGERTVVMTTHDIDEGLSLSDRLAVLARGRSSARDRPRDSTIPVPSALPGGGGTRAGGAGGRVAREACGHERGSARSGPSPARTCARTARRERHHHHGAARVPGGPGVQLQPRAGRPGFRPRPLGRAVGRLPVPGAHRRRPLVREREGGAMPGGAAPLPGGPDGHLPGEAAEQCHPGRWRAGSWYWSSSRCSTT